MKPEEIKIGETYNLRVKVLGKSEDFIHARLIAPNGEYSSSGILEILHKYAPSFAPIPSEHGTSVPTKYAPTRLFKKGDIVEINTHGRDIDARMKASGVELGKRYIVTEDEKHTGYVSFVGLDGIDHISVFFWLELVTPVEEQEPYFVQEFKGGYGIFNTRLQPETEVCHYFNDMHPHAKEAAEAECDRLNAEHRKEQNK